MVTTLRSSEGAAMGAAREALRPELRLGEACQARLKVAAAT
jgi:hypothetical protein